MRLINAKTLELVEFVGRDLPPYAILSHTWREEEVTFLDWQDFRVAEKKKGFQKIRSACSRALDDGYSFVWVDTNCIDKTSSSELSEAINSMFAWYRDAAVCYIYLDDVPSEGDVDSALYRSHWFTRGWTLQEIIAPRTCFIYSQDWVLLGDKDNFSLSSQISDITGIDVEFLLHGAPLSDASVAKRMAWMANRTTTRIEDMAYCLLGIFDINMSLLYGEGEKAFIRLQEEIIKVSNDQSIFCWKYSYPEVPRGWLSLLAPSPAAFRDSGPYYSTQKPLSTYVWVEDVAHPYAITNLGLSIELPTIHTCEGVGAILDVTSELFSPDDLQKVCLQLKRLNQRGLYCRTGLPETVLPVSGILATQRQHLYIVGRSMTVRDFGSFASMDVSIVENISGKGKLLEEDQSALFISFNAGVKVIASSLDNLTSFNTSTSIAQATADPVPGVTVLMAEMGALGNYIILICSSFLQKRTNWYVEVLRLDQSQVDVINLERLGELHVAFGRSVGESRGIEFFADSGISAFFGVCYTYGQRSDVRHLHLTMGDTRFPSTVEVLGRKKQASDKTLSMIGTMPMEGSLQTSSPRLIREYLVRSVKPARCIMGHHQEEIIMGD